MRTCASPPCRRSVEHLAARALYCSYPCNRRAYYRRHPELALKTVADTRERRRRRREAGLCAYCGRPNPGGRRCRDCR